MGAWSVRKTSGRYWMRSLMVLLRRLDHFQALLSFNQIQDHLWDPVLQGNGIQTTMLSGRLESAWTKPLFQVADHPMILELNAVKRLTETKPLEHALVLYPNCLPPLVTHLTTCFQIAPWLMLLRHPRLLMHVSKWSSLPLAVVVYLKCLWTQSLSTFYLIMK